MSFGKFECRKQIVGVYESSVFVGFVGSLFVSLSLFFFLVVGWLDGLLLIHVCSAIGCEARGCVLVDVDISNNRLCTLPLWLPWLPSLRVLRLRNNKITSLSIEKGQFRALEVLDIRENLIERLPPSLR